MCVTNTTHRRAQALALNAAQVSALPSVISQRLLGTFASSLPTAAPKPSLVIPQAETSCTQSHESSSSASYGMAAPDITGNEKQRPKRRRKPQKPGKTAKLNDRHFVVHNYHDHCHDNEVIEETEEEQAQRRRGGVAVAFPVKLHSVLDQVEADGLAHVVSWQPHGRCFVVHNPKEFVDHVMPRYFRQTKLTSFQRQLNLYGFSRLTRGADAGGYYHELFLRGKVNLCKKMGRTKVKGTKFKAASSPEHEPDFYQMEPVIVTPHNSSDEEMSYDSSHHTHETFTRQQQQQQPVMPMLPSYQQDLVQSYEPVQSMPYYFTQQMYVPQEQQPFQLSDQIFDEAVDELFMDEAIIDPSLSEFVQDWDPTSGIEPDIQDDAQLGFLLERLLED